MSEHPIQALARELGTAPSALPPPDPLRAEELQLLQTAMLMTRQRQQAHLRDALNAALKHVPALLRGPVRKVLFP